MKLHNLVLLVSAGFIFSSQPAYVAEFPLEDGKKFYSGTNKAVSALKVSAEGLKLLIENDGTFKDGENRYELNPEQMAEVVKKMEEECDKDLPQLAPTATEQQDWARLKKAIADFRHHKEIKFPQDKAVMLAKLKMLTAEIFETERLFYTRFATPTPSDPQLGMRWMVEALNFWHEYCGYKNDASLLPTFETINTIISSLTQELAIRNLSKNQKGDVMLALFRPWELDTFKNTAKNDWAYAERNYESYLPDSQPLAALFYSGALFDLGHAGLLMHISPESGGEQILGLLQSSCDKTLRAAEVLETQNEISTDLFTSLLRQRLNTTQGMSRYLAIELLHQTYTSLKKYVSSKVIDSSKVEFLRQRLAAKALGLSSDLQFSPLLGDESRTYQVYAFQRISLMHGPIQRFMFMLVANKIYQEATYRGLAQDLADYATGGSSMGLALNLKKDKIAIAECTFKLRAEAYKMAFDEAQSLFQRSKEAPTKLVDLVKADGMAILAANIAREKNPGEASKDNAEESRAIAALTALKASLDKELGALLDNLMRTQTQQFDEILASVQGGDIPFLHAVVGRAGALRSEFFEKISAAAEAFYAVKRLYNHSKLSWEFKLNPKVQAALTLCAAQKDAIQAFNGKIIEKQATSDRKQAEIDRALQVRKATLESSNTNLEQTQARANSVKEIAKTDGDEQANNDRKQAEIDKALQVRKAIQESYSSKLEQIRAKANSVKEIAKTEGDKLEQYSLVRVDATKFLSELTSSDYSQDSEVQRIKEALEMMIGKLDVFIKKYGNSSKRG